MKPKKATKPGEWRRRAQYYQKQFRNVARTLNATEREHYATKKDLALMTAQFEHEKSVRAFLYSVGVTNQRDSAHDFMEFRFRVDREIIPQIKDRESFIRVTVENFVERVMRKWEGRD